MTKNKQAGYWKNKENRIKETKAFVRKLGKPVSEINNYDFRNNGMNSLVCKTRGYRRALREAGFDVSIDRWIVVRPNNFWKPREIRINAIKEMVSNLSKPIRDINSQDFINAGLGGMFNMYYQSPYAALKDAGYNLEPWEMKSYPITIWQSKSNRIRAVKWLLKKLNKTPAQVKCRDFKQNGLQGLIDLKRSISRTLREAGFNVKDRKRPANYWQDHVTRVRHIVKLVQSSGKPADEIVYHDFRKAGLSTLIERYYGGSTPRALEDAGYELRPELVGKDLRRGSKKGYVSNHGHRFISIFERDLDNWLYDKGVIFHKHDVKYPGSEKKCDFVVGKYWIEAAGLLRYDFYDKKMRLKRELAIKNNLKLIIISLRDFYKKKILEQKLADVIREHGNRYNERLTKFTEEPCASKEKEVFHNKTITIS